jgi:uncharacterized membrane protein
MIFWYISSGSGGSLVAMMMLQIFSICSLNIHMPGKKLALTSFSAMVLVLVVGNGMSCIMKQGGGLQQQDALIVKTFSPAD